MDMHEEKMQDIYRDEIEQMEAHREWERNKEWQAMMDEFEREREDYEVSLGNEPTVLFRPRTLNFNAFD